MGQTGAGGINAAERSGARHERSEPEVALRNADNIAGVTERGLVGQTEVTGGEGQNRCAFARCHSKSAASSGRWSSSSIHGCLGRKARDDVEEESWRTNSETSAWSVGSISRSSSLGAHADVTSEREVSRTAGEDAEGRESTGGTGS